MRWEEPKELRTRKIFVLYLRRRFIWHNSPHSNICRIAEFSYVDNVHFGIMLANIITFPKGLKIYTHTHTYQSPKKKKKNLLLLFFWS